jgi:signal transduction histidine kinase
VLDGIRSAVVVVEGGVARVVNPAAGRLWGVAPGGRLPEGVASLGEGHHAEVPVGDARVHDVTVVPFGPDGRLFVAEDVTDRRRDRERLARSERLALVGQLLAQVTHEVRNPLNAMSLHAELLADTAMPDDARPLLTTIQAEILRLEDVTDRYLDLARRRPPELAPEDPVAVARSVIALEEASFRRAGIVGSVRTSTEGPTTAELDGNVVRRALLNLVRNALQSGARNIWIEVDRPPREARFVVADDGPGMPPEVAAHVFDPFFSTRARGTGLGLPITRQTVEDVGGSVALDTAPGAGTRVTLRFPTPE